MSKRGAVLLVILSFFVFAALYGCFRPTEADERDRAQREADWRQFSVEHHCVIARDQSFWNATTTWKCDGGYFEVRR